MICPTGYCPANCTRCRGSSQLIFSHNTIPRSRFGKFKSTRDRGGKKGKGKSKPQQQSQPPFPPPEQEEQYEDVNNYYHNKNYRGNNRGHRPYRANTAVGNHTDILSRWEGDNKIIIEANTKATVDKFIPLVAAIIIIIMAIIKIEVAMAMVKTIIDHAVEEEAITRAIIITNTINITCMMMVYSLNNMVHHAHFAVVSIILLKIVLRENMTSIISWRK